MKKPKPLDYKLFRQKLDVSQLGFKTTKEIKPLTKFIGQERALEALMFGIELDSQGYNLYAMGPTGIGKYSLINIVLSNAAKKRTTPSDWCYIHNFDSPEKPIAVELPAGLGLIFQQDMKAFLDEISASIVTVFESHEYQSRMKRIKKHYDKKRKAIAKTNDQDFIDKYPSLYKEQHEKEKEFESSSILSVIKPALNKLKKKYRKFKIIIDYLVYVQKDILDHVNDLVKIDEKLNVYTFAYDNPILINYRINLLVDNSKLEGAPVVFEELPTYSNLICRIEHTSQLGMLSTNITLIKSGSLHRANGGFLIIEARKLKRYHEAWEALKNALYAKKINIKSIESELDHVKPISLEPMPIPLNVKVILIGDRNTYYSLCQKDPDFLELFKVAVDFDEQITRNAKNIKLYARLIATIVKRNQLHPFHVGAVAEMIDYSSRLAEDIEKLSTYIRNLEDLIIEADYWSKIRNSKIIMEEDVKRAILAQVHRMDRSRDLYYEDIQREFIIIHTTGESIGQINCLSVRKVGNFSYGHPTRVTARVRLGKGKMIDIQREIKLAGPLHSKAGLIISNYISTRFNTNQPFSMFASLSFEQVYCWTDGDSASVGELCAILSALADVPLKQSLAVTGSVDQYGIVQAIGGVNEKIEGFYDVCKAKGLTGNQGVLIPSINVKNLMLRDDICQAAKAKQFFIYPINTIDDAITILTGMEAGERNAEGQFPKGSIYHKIENKLQHFAKNRLRKLLE